MSGQSKQSILERETTRRDFLKLTGKGVGGVILSFSMLSLFGCGKSKEVGGFALSKGLLIADRNKCTGCQRCEVTCSAIHEGKIQPYISKVKVSRNFNYGLVGPSLNYMASDGEYGNRLMNPETCKQCREPFCGNACPQHAIVSDPNNKGARVVMKDKCIGCGTCTKACPWHLPTVDPETKKSSKCKACGVCATVCPTGALKLIPWADVKATLNKNGYLLG